MTEDDLPRVAPSAVAPDRLDLPRSPQLDSSPRTPGPWRVFTERYVEKGLLLIDVVDSSLNTVCEVNQSTEPCFERHLANARLIAAAPELLAAAKSILQMYGPPSDYDDPAKAAWQVLATAIAKAEGHG